MPADPDHNYTADYDEPVIANGHLFADRAKT
jgi:hypothetical protein